MILILINGFCSITLVLPALKTPINQLQATRSARHVQKTQSASVTVQSVSVKLVMSMLKALVLPVLLTPTNHLQGTRTAFRV